MTDNDARQKENNVVVGIDIGGTKVALLAVEDDGETEIARRRFATPEGIDVEGILALVRDEVAAMLSEAGRDIQAIEAVGAAVPGLVNADGHLISAGNLGWSDFPFRQRLAELFGVPAFSFVAVCLSLRASGLPGRASSRIGHDPP